MNGCFPPEIDVCTGFYLKMLHLELKAREVVYQLQTL